jgi:glucuronokinase
MNSIASLADSGFKVASERPYSAAGSAAAQEAVGGEWAALFAANFNTRRKLFGDPALGKDNIRMVEIARSVGASAKFPGSGGAVVGVVDVQGMAAAGQLPGLEGASASERITAATSALRAAYHAEGYVFIRLQPHEQQQ